MLRKPETRPMEIDPPSPRGEPTTITVVPNRGRAAVGFNGASLSWTCTTATSAAATTPAAPVRRLRTFGLLQLGPEGRLSLGHAEHRVVELVESVVYLLDVVVVHAADQLLQRRDSRAEAVAQLAVRGGQRSRDPGRLTVRLKRLH